ncbi:MAG TPA: DUF1249 domain-containing protein [Gammaproteobacteria bacterium]|nr:DUF1249 domain-containing protein [Gammaproteobacteria bacterium]
MLVDSLIVPECVYRPGSFTGLMTLYESNYIKLTTLIEPLAALHPKRPRPAVSSSTDDCDLHLEPVAMERYTTTVKLTYWFDDAGERVADPDLTVRVYHDARLAEAVHGADTPHHHEKLQELASQVWGGVHSLELDRRWRNNMMLNKWLDYLLDMGHGFT